MSSESRKHSYKRNIKKRETYFKKGNQAYLQRQDIQMKLSQDEVVEDTGKDRSSKEEVCTWIIELFGYCKGGYFKIHIWAWFAAFICSEMEIRFYLFGKKIRISCLGCANKQAFHENPDHIFTVLTFIKP